MCCRNKTKPPINSEPILLGGKIHKNYLNVSIIGDSGVGKTCLLRRFRGGGFPPMVAVTTIDIWIMSHLLENGESISIRLWDTAGQETYHAITGATIRQSEAAILVYDESVPQTLEHLCKLWYPLVRDSCPKLRYILVIGNKNDILSTEEVHRKIEKYSNDLGELSQTHRSSFISISAMKADTVSCQQVFHQFCTRVLNDIKEADPGHYQDFLLVRH